MISTLIITENVIDVKQASTYGMITVSALIIILAFKEILSAETYKNNQIKSFIDGSNVLIIPLLLIFTSIIIYKVVTVF